MVLQILSNISRLLEIVAKPLLILTALGAVFFAAKNNTASLKTITQVTGTPEATQVQVTSQVKQTPAPTPKPTARAALSGLTYPSASILSEGVNNLKLQTPDSPDTVTNYYKAKITALKPGAKSFALTKTNGLVLNKLAYSDSGHQVTIEIKTASSGSGSEITISRD